MAGTRTPFIYSALVALAVAAAQPAFAVETPAENVDALSARQAESRAEYERLTSEAALSKEKLAALTAEIAAIRKDNTSLTAALIQTAKTEKKLADDVSAIEERLSGLTEQQSGIRLSLAGRRDILAEVLGALQRMGLNPPPALLVTPDDALSSVRSAILLGAVVPDLNAEAQVLLTDLKELSRIAATIGGEHERLVKTIAEQVEEKGRLSLLLEERKRLQAKSEEALTGEAMRAAELARKADSVQGLIASLETDLSKARQAVEKARLAEEEQRRKQAETAGRSVPEANRLVQSPPFDALKRQVAFPVAGQIVKRFGDSDGIGGSLQGDTVATQSAAIVTSPAEGSVLYAGPFRSYGQLLILNAGGGYHVVLSGMGRINVALGQTVLAGEPVGAMEEARLASAAEPPVGNTAPELYVEFRKDGKPVDPSPWWSDRSSGRTRNGT